MTSNSISPSNLAEEMPIEMTELASTRTEGHEDPSGAFRVAENIISGHPDHHAIKMDDVSRAPSQTSLRRSTNSQSPGQRGKEKEVIPLIPGLLSDHDKSASTQAASMCSLHAEQEHIKPQNVHSLDRKDGQNPALEFVTMDKLPLAVGQTPALKNDGVEKLLGEILEALQDSSIAGPTAAKHDRSRFWGKYKRVAEEYDLEFLERYTSDMDIVLIFAGLFSAVSASFIVAMESSLVPDPIDTTNALLIQIAYMLGNSTAPGQVQPVTLPVFSGPSQMDVWVQTIAYLSLASTLLAAFSAVLGKQWLGYYKAGRYGRGSLEEKGLRRQEKFEGLQTWYFDAILQSIPLLIQFSLFLFGLALSGHMWSEQRTIASVIIATTAFGTVFYIFTLFASLLSPACPFQSPLSTIFCFLWSYISQMYSKLHNAVILQFPVFYLSTLLGFKKATSSALHGFIHYLIHRLFHPFHAEDKELGIHHSSGEAADSITNLNLPDTSLKGMETSSVLWLLETSTDPEVLVAASRMVPDVEWHPDFDVSRGFIQISQTFLRSFGVDGKLIPSEYDKAMSCGYALNYLRWEMDEKSVQAIKTMLNSVPHSDLDNFWDDIDRFLHQLGEIENPFLKIVPKFASSYNMVALSDEDQFHTYASTTQIQDILRILHLLPYASFNFSDPSAVDWRFSVVRALVIRIIPRILNRQHNLTFKSPGVSDCAMVIGRCLGLQFDFRDMRKLDKSQAFNELIHAIYMKITAIFQINPPELVNKSMVERLIALDCIPFVLSLLPLLSPDSYYAMLETDRHLSICKGCFDLEAATELDDTWPNLSALKTSIQQTLDALNPDYCKSQTTDAGWKSSLWDGCNSLQVQQKQDISDWDHARQAGAPATYSYPALGDVHSYPALGDVHSYPALGDVHSYPALGDVHSYPALGDVHSYPALGDVHSYPALGNVLGLEIGFGLKPATWHHPWLLEYLHYLCDKFSTENISDLQCTLLLSIYSLEHLERRPDEIQSYLSTIIFCMGTDKPDELRCAALRAIYAKRDIFRSIVIQPTPKWRTLLKEFSATLLSIIQHPPFGEGRNAGQRLEEAKDLIYCIYYYIKLIVDLAHSAPHHLSSFDFSQLIKDHHLEASLITPSTLQIVGMHPSFTLLCVPLPIAAQTSFHFQGDIWQSLLKDFWENLRMDLLKHIAGDRNLWSVFKEALPRIIQLTSEHVDSAEGALLILPTISEARQRIQWWTRRTVHHEKPVVNHLSNDLKLKELQEKLKSMIN